MLFKNSPIKQKILWLNMLTSGAILLLTFVSLFIYEFITFRHRITDRVTIQAKIIANNSTAALAFDSREEADHILGALKVDDHIVAAALYNKRKELFSYYPENFQSETLPEDITHRSYRFENSSLVFFEPVVENDEVLGVLFIRSDMDALYARLLSYLTIAGIIVLISGIVGYFLSSRLQRSITMPVLELAETAKAISIRKDYTVRASKICEDEIGLLTDAFNQMLSEILEQNMQIQQFNQKLEATIKQRTEDLEITNKELEAFSYSVSHDLRAPLRSINGFSQILLEDFGHVLNEQGINSLNRIINNGARMGQLIDDLLAFSRLGKQNVAKVPLDMKAIAENVCDDLKVQYGDGVETHIDDLPEIKGDRSMLKQVMQNLVSNAFKYSLKKKNPVIEIGAYSEENQNTYYVRDNGAGFNMKYYDKLFGVFQRLHSPSEFEGTGVGLALVQRIISKHGGRVWAEAKVNEGATFYFSLPLNNN